MDSKNRIQSSLMMQSCLVGNIARDAWQYPHKTSTSIGLSKLTMAFDNHNGLYSINECGNNGLELDRTDSILIIVADFGPSDLSSDIESRHNRQRMVIDRPFQ